MLRWELRIVDNIRKNILWWAAAASALLGAFIRYSFLPLMVADMEFMLKSWYDATVEGGLYGAGVISTYSPLYMYIFPLLVKVPLPYDMAIKLVTIATEIVLLAASSLTVYWVAPAARKKLYTTVVFIILCMHPVLILNGAGWGQADICFAAFSLLAVWQLLRGKSIWAMACFGIAFALKLQAILLLPMFIIYYFCEKQFSVWQFLIIPAIWVASGVPMAFVGHSPLFAVTSYIGQVGMYPVPTYNYPNLYALLGDALSNKQMIQGMLSRYGLALAVVALGGIATWLIAQKAVLTERAYLLLGSLCVLCCVFFMPQMHERYGLVGEILLLCWAVCLGKPRGFAWALLGTLPVVSAYCQYMFRKPMFTLQLGSVMNLALLGILAWELLRETSAAAGRQPAEAANTGDER